MLPRPSRDWLLPASVLWVMALLCLLAAAQEFGMSRDILNPKPSANAGSAITGGVLAAVFAGLGMVVWWAAGAGRAPPPLGHCRRCAYDLAGLDTGRCPECGGAFPARHRNRTPPRQ
jgi:hypothetical protein